MTVEWIKFRPRGLTAFAGYAFPCCDERDRQIFIRRPLRTAKPEAGTSVLTKATSGERTAKQKAAVTSLNQSRMAESAKRTPQAELHFQHAPFDSLFLHTSLLRQITAKERTIFFYPEIPLAHPLRFQAGQETTQMEAIAKSGTSSRPRNIDWPFYVFWLTYFSIIFGVVYVIVV